MTVCAVSNQCFFIQKAAEFGEEYDYYARIAEHYDGPSKNAGTCFKLGRSIEDQKAAMEYFGLKDCDVATLKDMYLKSYSSRSPSAALLGSFTCGTYMYIVHIKRKKKYKSGVKVPVLDKAAMKKRLAVRIIQLKTTPTLKQR